MFSVVIFFLLIVFWQCTVNKKECYNETLSYESTIAIKGICSLEIMIGHIGLELSNELILYPFRKAGVLIVGVFFFISGYGLMYSMKNKPNYLDYFIKKRFLNILIPVGIVLAFSTVLFIVSSFNDNKNIYDIFIQVICSINWFVWEIMLYYILFYFLFKRLKVSSAQMLIFLITIILIIACYIFKMDNPWYGSNLCFPLGIFVANNKESFDSWSIKRGIIKIGALTFFLTISIFMFYIFPDRSITGSILGRNLAAVCFTLLIVLILYNIKLGNRVTRFLGKVSFEIYLIHPLVIYFFHSSIINIKNNIYYSWIVIIVTIILSCLLNSIDQRLKKYLTIKHSV